MENIINTSVEKKGKGLGLPLVVIATAQLMVVLDDTIANIALPTLQNSLGLSAANLPWVINAYILAFGGLLLFGGRMGDLFGRRRMLRVGMMIFTVASLFVGLSQNGMMVIAFRALQGIGAAFTAPNALALIATTFPEGKERNKAMAVYGAMSGLGIIVGLILGGVLTGTLGWRWAFFINLPIGAAVLAGSGRLKEAELHKGRPDIIGAVSSILGMASLVYGITRGGEHGWTDSITLFSFAVSAILLPLFIFIQSRNKDPLVPLRLFTERNRAGSYIATLLLGFGPMGMLYLMTLYMQHILEFSPVSTALSFLPFSIGIIFGAGVSTKLLTRLAPRLVAAPGAVIGAIALFWLSNLELEGNFLWHFVPAVFLTAFGFVMGIISLALTAVRGVQAKETGVASALFNASQQIGVALGLAVLSTVAISTTDEIFPNAMKSLYEAKESGNSFVVKNASLALIDGYAMALIAGAIVFVVAAIVIAIVVNAHHDPNQEKNNLSHL